MYRFTTPTITLRMPSTVSVGNITSLVVTIAQESVKVEKELADVVISQDANTITFRMTQQETGGFAKGQATTCLQRPKKGWTSMTTYTARC